MHRSLLVALILLSACGKSKEGGDKAAPSAREGKPAAGDAAALFTGSTVTLPAEVAKLAFGGAKADVLAAAGATSGYVTSKTLEGVSYDLDFDPKDKLE